MSPPQRNSADLSLVPGREGVGKAEVCFLVAQVCANGGNNSNRNQNRDIIHELCKEYRAVILETVWDLALS